MLHTLGITFVDCIIIFYGVEINIVHKYVLQIALILEFAFV